jgi:7-carboxy-7-deazaguanine synthase
MKVSEIFQGLQGEGPLIGKPTIFIRLSGCNLSCEWCDSKYHTRAIKFNMAELVKFISDSNIKSITYTGGESTLQESDIEFKNLIREFDDYHLALETNGTIMTKFVWDTIVVTPKKQKINKYVLKKYAQMENTYFKFVYENKNDRWWEKLIDELKIIKERIYIMPEGATKVEQAKKMQEVWEYCVREGFNFSPRLHVLIYDKKRGV